MTVEQKQEEQERQDGRDGVHQGNHKISQGRPILGDFEHSQQAQSSQRAQSERSGSLVEVDPAHLEDGASDDGRAGGRTCPGTDHRACR